MHRTRPLPDTHPEFTVIDWPGFTEYRVEHWRLARDGSGRVVHGARAWSWTDIVVALVVPALLAWSEVTPAHALVGAGTALAYLVWTRCTQVLHESLLVFPTLGVQLETHRGHPTLPTYTLRTTRHFIPLSALEDVVVHEGFRRWDVRFYLAVLRRRRRRAGGAGVRVCVAFENVLPYFPVLKAVYLGVQETLFFVSPSQSGREDGQRPVMDDADE